MLVIVIHYVLKVLVPSASLGVLDENELGDYPSSTARDSSQKTMDLESHLRGMILSNNAPSTDPSTISQGSANTPVAQYTKQAELHQPAANVSQRINSGKRNAQSLNNASTASRKQSNQTQITQLGGQAKRYQPLAPPIASAGSILARQPSTQAVPWNPAFSQAQQTQNLSQSAPRQLHMAASHSAVALNGKCNEQQGYQGPLSSPRLRSGQAFANGQPMEVWNPHRNFRSRNTITTSRSARDPGIHHAHRPSPSQPSPYTNRNTQNQSQYTEYLRPVPQSRQIYEPSSHQTQNYNQYRIQNNSQMSNASMRAQAVFLEQLSGVEIPKAAISLEELQEKEALRLVLEDICRITITQHERKKDDAFEGGSVALKCFGSLASGFATHSADMDLALVSPQSKPDSSSSQSEIPRLLEKALLDLGFGVRLLTRTRVPIIKFCEKPPPELAAKLREERAKYEKERDAPPRPKKTKNTKDPNKIMGKAETSAAEKAANDYAQTAQTLEVGQTSHVVSLPNVQHIENTDTADTKNLVPLRKAASQEHIVMSAAVINNVDDAKMDETKFSPENEGSSAKKFAQTINISDEQRAQVSKDNTAVQEEKATDLSLFTDEELVRLYNLAIKEGWYEPAERAIIMKFSIAVNKYGPNSDCVDLHIARSKLQTLTDILKRYRAPHEHHLDFPKSGAGIQCDINFSNQLALHNTRLLKCYGLCDSRVRPVVLFVKAWAKRRKINSPYHGTLSSYGYVLMVLHYLVNVAQPSVAPNLQVTRKALQDKSSENEAMVDGYNVRFWRSESEIMDLAKRGMLTHNRDDSVGSLLRGFFQYFAHPHAGFSWSTDVLSLRTEGGLLSKAQKGWTGAKTVVSTPTAPGQEQKEVRHRYLFAIEDPFEIDHNVARTVVHNGIVAIRDEFRRAHVIIQSAGIGDGRRVDDLFAEAESKENLQYRAFGPKPKEHNAPIKKEGKQAVALDPGKEKEGEPQHRSSDEKPGSVGATEGSRVNSDGQISLAKSSHGSDSVEHGNVDRPPKPVDNKGQSQVNSRGAQVSVKAQNRPSTSEAMTKSKGNPVQKKLRHTGSFQAKIGEAKVPLRKRNSSTEKGIDHSTSKERNFGPVYKNGKEVAGSSGRIGEAGVIPSRPDLDANTDFERTS